MPCLIPFFNPAYAHKVDVLIMGKERWFRVSDIANSLGYYDGGSITSRWKEEVCVFTAKDLPGVNLGARAVRFVTRDGLLAFLLSSSRPTAQILRKWITEDVLPTTDCIAFDSDTGQSAFDRAVLKELGALKAFRQNMREKQERQVEMAIQNIVHAIVSWVDNAPMSHVKLFQEALQDANFRKG